jgi:hypothetical protein
MHIGIKDKAQAFLARWPQCATFDQACATGGDKQPTGIPQETPAR